MLFVGGENDASKVHKNITCDGCTSLTKCEESKKSAKEKIMLVPTTSILIVEKERKPRKIIAHQSKERPGWWKERKPNWLGWVDKNLF